MSERKAHVHPVFLPAELYVGISGVQYKYEIGKSASILLMITEGLHSEKLITEEAYKKYQRQYQKKLVEILKKTESLTKEQIEENEKHKQLEKEFNMVIDQWSIHPDLKWRLQKVQRAEKYKDKIPSAKLLLELANKEEVPNEQF
ncbi:hypothetical protein JW988_04670 [Candidatus Bathyarchaeota archaeon]|nr:hypothetical protein [Candidatus Bathyarchaeota archaeon]